jgi:RND family efflux transporter MFP subunit
MIAPAQPPDQSESGNKKPDTKAETLSPQKPSGDKPSGMGPMGMPPANVVVDDVTSGTIAPMSDFIGTVYFDEVSNVASEVGGIVESIGFEEGEMVKKGQILVSLDSELLRQKLHTKQASFNQGLVELEKARLDFKRTEKLFQDITISEQTYDDDRFRVQSQEKKLLLIKAESDEIDAELRKKVIMTPFDGVVIEKKVEIGEWLPPGGVAASIANQKMIDIRVFAPQKMIPFINPGTPVTAYVNQLEIPGRVLSVIPKGDVGSRTFPVRIRVEAVSDLKEGMEAKVMLPTGERRNCLLVSRDALITKFGLTVIFAIQNGVAKMIPVNVIGYEGSKAGIQAMGIQPGFKVVVKGNERILDGALVMVSGPGSR